jgi:hypothetical protein
MYSCKTIEWVGHEKEQTQHEREYMGKIIILTNGSLTKPCDMKQDMNQPKISRV